MSGPRNDRSRERERERVCGGGDSFPNGDKYFAFGFSRRRVRRIFIVSRRAEWGREREGGREGAHSSCKDTCTHGMAHSTPVHSLFLFSGMCVAHCYCVGA